MIESRPGSVVIRDVSVNDVGGTSSPEKIPVFLQMGSAVRRTLVSLTELSLQSIRLLFVEKFQFNPGVDTFPDILVTDRETGVRYILEEGIQDITEGTVLTLDVEGMSLVSWGERLIVVDSTLKKTFTEGIATLMKEMGTLQQTILSQQGMLTSLSDQHTSLRQDLSSHRHETIQKIQDIQLKPSISPTSPYLPQPTPTKHSPRSPTTTTTTSTHHLNTLKSLKQDLQSLRTDHKTFQSNLESSLSNLRSLPLLTTTQQPDPLSNQKSRLESTTQHLVTLSDDLSDQVDDLRIDITQKRIRPHPRVLTTLRKQETLVQKELESVDQLLRTLKPVWKRKWEEELQQVIDGQEFLRHQETLVADLRKDLVDTQTVVTQIVQAAEILESNTPPRREWLSGGLGSGGRDAVLGEVKTLQPNSQERIEAIKRAERARLRELEMRKESEFQVELTEVVTEGKLRIQSEGAKRVEREREEKDQRIRQQLWEARNPQKQKRTNGTSSTPLKEVEKTGGGGDGSTGVKRTVSEGNQAFSETQDDDVVARSHSHSSGLSRMKAVSGGSSSGASTTGSGGGSQGKRGSGIMDFVKRTSSSLASSRSSGASAGVAGTEGGKDNAGVD